MELHRWAGVGAVALVLALVPDAIHHPASDAPAGERSPVGSDGVVLEPAAPVTPSAAPASVEAAPPTRPAPVPVARPPLAAPEGDVFALLIGINDYPGVRRDLRAAVADVETIDAALDGFGVPAANRVVLRDGQATLPQVRASVQALVARGGPGATYVFAYTGHVRKLDRDTEAMVLADDGLLRDAELAALVAPAATQRFWFLLSACYAAGFTELLAPGRVLTAAADANSLAWESPDLNASYLVHQMIREGWLRGKAGASVQAAFAYAHATLSREHPNRVPVQIDQLREPLVLGERRPAAPAPAPPPPRQPTTAEPVATRPPPEPEEDPCFLGVMYC
jgi:cell division septation protein DedD